MGGAFHLHPMFLSHIFGAVGFLYVNALAQKIKRKAIMKMYHELAIWWPLLSPPEDYKNEAKLFSTILSKRISEGRNVLELGSGGGNSASYMKENFKMVLLDRSIEMIRVSKKLNSDCSHLCADMRHFALKKTFDAIFIHDAIMYLTEKEDLIKTFQNCFDHLKVDGVLLIAPDYYEETYKPTTSHGGIDKDGRGFRYLEWSNDTDPDDSIIECDFVYIYKEDDGEPQITHERHHLGIFSRETWLYCLNIAGFEAETRTFTLEEDDIHYELLIAKKRI